MGSKHMPSTAMHGKLDCLLLQHTVTHGQDLLLLYQYAPSPVRDFSLCSRFGQAKVELGYSVTLGILLLTMALCFIAFF